MRSVKKIKSKFKSAGSKVRAKISRIKTRSKKVYDTACANKLVSIAIVAGVVAVYAIITHQGNVVVPPACASEPEPTQLDPNKISNFKKLLQWMGNHKVRSICVVIIAGIAYYISPGNLKQIWHTAVGWFTKKDDPSPWDLMSKRERVKAIFDLCLTSLMFTPIFWIRTLLLPWIPLPARIPFVP